MTKIPSGNITFLFTDIEGSTKLAQEFPETLPFSLDRHYSIMLDAIESNKGFIFKIVGDAFCCSFNDACDAVKAACDAQINLRKEKWEEAIVKVRMAIHSGNGEWNGNRYLGYITLARSARLMSAAYGEQILISYDAYKLAKGKIPNEISFRDLGERRLKDVTEPILLFQIIAPSLREDFPPLKTLDARPNNLPVQLTSFIGREEEMKQVKGLLKHTHLLTVTGSGGAGKTRFALQVAADVIDDFANGIWFIELASLLEPVLLPQAIMKVFGVKEEPKRSPDDTLCNYLKGKELLIILDNCEHLIGACSKLTEKLLRNNRKLKIIATSREALRCEGEQTHRVQSLAIPDPQEDLSPEVLSQYEAVRLFIERALAVNSAFRVNSNNAPALAQICYQLDGIPLAIELAAARTRVLSVEKIYERLKDRFNLLTGGKRTALPRQQTLRALIDWSYDLISEKEKILWRRLSVFAGGWSLEAAEEVCSDEKIVSEEVLELLNQLNGKSIIIFDREKERYRILETLKQYGEEKLKEINESEEISSKHLHYFVKISETAEPKLKGSDMQVWLEKLEADHSNLHSAIEWSIKDGDKEEGVRLAGALGYFWKIRGDYSPGKQLMENVLENARDVSKVSRAKLINGLGSIIVFLGEYEEAQKFFEESLSLRREMGDKSGIAASLNSLGNIAYSLGNYEQAQKFTEQSLTLRCELGDNHGIAAAKSNLATIAYYRGDNKQAQKLYQESVTFLRQVGDKSGIAFCLNNLGILAKDRGNFEKAQKLYEESLSLSREIGEKRGIAGTLNSLGMIVKDQGSFKKAQNLFEESLTISREIGEKRGVAFSLSHLGSLAYNQGNYEEARKFFNESLILRREMGEKRGIAFSLHYLGNVAYNQEITTEQSRILFEESLMLRREMGDRGGIAECLDSLGNIACNNGKHALAERLYDESLNLRNEIGDKSSIADTLSLMGNFMYKRGNYKRAQKFYMESLSLRLESGFEGDIINDLLGYARFFCADNKRFIAITLLGTIEEKLKSMGKILHRDGKEFQEQIIKNLREKVSDQEFSKYFEEGKKLSYKQAADLALSNVQ